MTERPIRGGRYHRDAAGKLRPDGATEAAHETEASPPATDTPETPPPAEPTETAAAETSKSTEAKTSRSKKRT